MVRVAVGVDEVARAKPAAAGEQRARSRSTLRRLVMVRWKAACWRHVEEQGHIRVAFLASTFIRFPHRVAATLHRSKTALELAGTAATFAAPAMHQPGLTSAPGPSLGATACASANVGPVESDCVHRRLSLLDQRLLQLLTQRQHAG